MRVSLLLIVLLCTLLPAWANPELTKLIDWNHKPAEVEADLAGAGIDAELKMFHKTGVPYLKAEISTLGNTWEGTVYFNEQDLPNMCLLQLDDMTASGANRVQKLAVGEFGESYKVRTAEGSQRDDHFLTWEIDGLEVELNTVTYRKRGTKTLWLKIRPQVSSQRG